MERPLMKGWGSAVWRWLPAVAAVVGVLGLLWVILVVAPPWFVPDQSLEGLRTQNEVRTTLLQGLGGAALLMGAYVTYRQLQTSREGQITERFTRAIDQLGSEHLDVRLGGLYALARIARDSPADRASIGEVLTAFVRAHAPWPPSLPDQPAASAPIEQVPKLQARAPDVQASLWVLGRGGYARALGHYRWLDLSGVDLRRADLRDADLGDVDFRFAGLQKAYLAGAYLQGADLDGSHLEGAYLGGAQLDGATLDGAHLEGAVADHRTAWPDGFNWRAARVAPAK